MKNYIWLFILLISCGNSKDNYILTDLLPYGEAIKVMAPQNASVIVEDYGLIKDIIITDSSDYSIQIFISKTNSLNLENALEDQKTIVKEAQFFSQILEEEDHGFIYEKKIDEDLLYDFRYVKIQADKKYIFQPSLSGGHSQEHVRKMYEAINQ